VGSPERSSTTRTERTTTTEKASTTAATTTTTRPPATLGEDSLVAVRCGEGTVSVSALDPKTEGAREVLDATFEGEMDCTHRATFSEDFTKALLTIDDQASGLSHIAVLHLGTGVVTDLTAARVGDGSFSDTPLDEYGAAFISEGGSPITYGSDKVVFESTGGDGIRQTSLSDPTMDEQFAPDPRPLGDEWDQAAGHQELAVWARTSAAEVFNENGAPVANPGGTLLLADFGGDDPSVWPAAGSSEDRVSIPCGGGEPLGWIDDTRLAMFWDYGDNGRNGNLQIVTVAPDATSADCGPNMIPSNSNTVGPARLRLDRSAVDFTASAPGSKGPSWYTIPITGGEPQPTPGHPLPEDTLIFDS
jgi:hypothetical protein